MKGCLAKILVIAGLIFLTLLVVSQPRLFELHRSYTPLIGQSVVDAAAKGELMVSELMANVSYEENGVINVVKIAILPVSIISSIMFSLFKRARSK